MYNGALSQNFVYICYTHLHKIHQNAPIFGIFQSAATIQERPILAQIRYMKIAKYYIFVTTHYCETRS